MNIPKPKFYYCRYQLTKNKYKLLNMATYDAPLIDSVMALSADMAALQHNVPGDVVVECEGQEIRGHSLVFIARSNVFAKTLQTDMKESRDGKIHIDRASMVGVKQLVDYITCVQESLIRLMSGSRSC